MTVDAVGDEAADAGARLDEGEAFVVRTQAYEGPLDLLLDLARRQKIDLTTIQILPLVEQYLAFVRQARRMRLELAADYLVMAAWLAYLKSRLLVPAPSSDPDEPDAEELAERLAFRLRRLEAMREASGQLMERALLGRDVFARGDASAFGEKVRVEWTASVYELVKAYARRRLKSVAVAAYAPERPAVLTIEEARARLEAMLGSIPDWSALDDFCGPDAAGGPGRRSRLASFLVASLELARDGRLELRQMKPFDPIYVREKGAGA